MEWKSNEQSILFWTNLLNTKNNQKLPSRLYSLVNIALLSVITLLCKVVLFIVFIRNGCDPSKSVISSSLPLEVLIRTPVTRTIVVSREPLLHSLDAHFITGSEAHRGSAVMGGCFMCPLHLTSAFRNLFSTETGLLECFATLTGTRTEIRLDQDSSCWDHNYHKPTHN